MKSQVPSLCFFFPRHQIKKDSKILWRLWKNAHWLKMEKIGKVQGTENINIISIEKSYDML